MLFYAYFSVSRKRNIRRSQNGMKSTGEVTFGRKAIQGTWSARQERRVVPTRVGGAPPWLVPPLRSTNVLLSPIYPTYPKTSRTEIRSGVPPPQASVATKNQSGPCSGTLQEGYPITGGHLHHPGAIHDEERVVHP